MMTTPTRKPYPPRAKVEHTIDTLHGLCHEVGDCWEWTRSCVNGHPTTRHGGKQWLVRRLVAQLTGDTLRKNYVVVTTCENPLCIHPEHLVQHTLRKHMTRMGELGRQGGLARAAKIAATKRAKYAKLTEAQVRDIRASTAPLRELATQYGLSHGRLGGIRSGRFWRDFSSPFAGLGNRGQA